MVAVDIRFEADGAAPGEFDGVGEQVEQDLAQAQGVVGREHEVQRRAAGTEAAHAGMAGEAEALARRKLLVLA